MGRLVRATEIVSREVKPDAVADGVDNPPAGEPPKIEDTVKEQGDTYLERVAKYVPAEIVAFFIFASSILKQSHADLLARNAKPEEFVMAGISLDKIGIAVFLLALVCVPIYLWRQAEPGDSPFLNAAMATALFPIWGYAVEGVGVTHWLPFDGHLASIVLGAASLLSGLVGPKTKKTVV